MPPWLRLASASPEPARAHEVDLDDEALIDAVERGDTRRAHELHDRLIAAIEPTLYRVLGRREPDHDDLVQATFEQIVLTLRRGRFARGCRLSTWASAIAAHVAFNALRARRRARGAFETRDVAEVIEDGSAIDGRMIGDTEREIGIRARIRAAQVHLTAMNHDRALVLVLHDVLGHDLAEIAAMLEVSVAAAQSRLVRGRKEFHARVRAEDELEEGRHG